MKALSRLLSALILLISLVGCGPTIEPTSSPAASAPATITAAAPTPTVAPTVATALQPTPSAKPAEEPYGVTPEWEGQMQRLVWVAYTPTTSNPNAGVPATAEAVRADLAVLREAGFTGLVTYSAAETPGYQLDALAAEQGFKGLLVGVWNPKDAQELAVAEALAKSPIVLGYAVGNEGLGERYTLAELKSAIDQLRRATGKPVTTTEQIDDYGDPALLALGDWVFPNAHPYFHKYLDPGNAVTWTQEAYEQLRRRSERFVLFKEVGLPTAGDPSGQLSEEAQEQYYRSLAQTNVRFVYFEAFDQPWKDDPPVEPHWGIFRADRTPKILGWKLMGKEPPEAAATTKRFYIYQDSDSSDNHFRPTGLMGDVGDIKVFEVDQEQPYAGSTAIRITYSAKGLGPNECPEYGPPCNWAGVYWQQPPNNWGKDEVWKNEGFDLSEYKRLVFSARADHQCAAEVKVGGITGPFGDSLAVPRTISVPLNQEWREFKIDLQDADLTRIIGGLAFVTNIQLCPGGGTFFLDEIRFEG